MRLFNIKSIHFPDGELFGNNIERYIVNIPNIYREILEKIPLVCGVLDCKGRIIAVNKQVNNIMKYTPQDVIGHNFLDFVHPDDSEMFYKEIINDLEKSNKEAKKINEYRALYGDGKYYWQQISWESYYDDHGAFDHVVFYALDINDRKSLDIAFKDVNDGLTDGIGVYDENDYLIKYSNKSLSDLFGYEAEEINGKHILNFIGPQDVDMVRSYAQRRKQGDKDVPKKYKALFLKKNKIDTFFGEITISEFRKGANTSRIMVIRDLTEQISREEEEKKAEEKKQMEERQQLVGTLAGGIAHDLNNIFTGILGYLDLFVKNPNPSDYRSLKSQLLRAVKIANQFLTFSKGGLPVKEDCSVEELIDDICSFYSHVKNIKIETFIESALWKANIDKDKIGTALENLIKNADESMGSLGEIKIYAKNYVAKDNDPNGLSRGSYISIKVQDEGPGMPKEYLNKIFETCFTTKRGGHGLGLFQVKDIINKHGGAIKVNSVQGSGTTFTVLLPAIQGVDLRMYTPKNDNVEKMGQGEIILVMDDEDILLKLMRTYLLTSNYKFIGAKDGAEAVEKFRSALSSNEKITAVILDLTIRGGMDGTETLKVIKQLDPTVKAVVCSGYSEGSVLSNYTDYGFSACLKKPFLKEDLQEVLANLLREKAMVSSDGNEEGR